MTKEKLCELAAALDSIGWDITELDTSRFYRPDVSLRLSPKIKEKPSEPKQMDVTGCL